MENLRILDDLLTVHEVATYIKRSYKTTLKLIKQGKIRVVNDGARGYRISKIDLYKYLGFIGEDEKPEQEELKKRVRRR
ncbi:excisionase family DNA-binding protein [Parasporobacterium paucivorans]|uniref:DNA binding domain-containing protein, excisionase family n=1 Tax=Parasporobacterium paucivorans DSM 15970 TaxID=1122934 RepID=A0A1M6IPC8_9FIRM|nr:helix-turn-helix domain-containing protein [Parasporobacterium paucivorans]SHJ36199.1 DNA binding domain-containing protein, excisionase family [Parasporobacterium paucivorans DSM 15970]